MKYARATFRLVIFLLATFGLYVLWYLISFFVPNKTFWRQFAFQVWARTFLWIANIDVQVIGRKPVSPFFLVSNHLSYVDIPLLRAVVDAVFVAKVEVSHWFVVGRIVKSMGNIFIDRKKRRDIPRAGQEIIRRLTAGESVIVFPEGTSSKGESILPFNSSFLQFAAQCDLPVSHVSISYRTPDNSRPASEMICWWDDTTLFAHLFRLFTLKGFTAILDFGEEAVIDADRKRLAAELHKRVAASFIPVI